STRTPRLPRPIFFPYTTLFRSKLRVAGQVTTNGGVGRRIAAGEHRRLARTQVAPGSSVGLPALSRRRGRDRAGMNNLQVRGRVGDRKSTRLNSSHVKI